MKIFLNAKMVLLLLVGLLTSMGCRVDKAELDELVDQQESFATSRAENVTITGTVLDPKTWNPIVGATVTIGDYSTTTNALGFYSLDLEETGLGAIVTVTKEGRVDLRFPVDFRRYNDNATVHWNIELPEIQKTISFTPGIEQEVTFFYLGVWYKVIVPADAASKSLEISVGPTGTVVGEGISGAFALTGLFLETPHKCFQFDNKIMFKYDAVNAATNGGVGSANRNAMGSESTPGSRIVAAGVETALQKAKAILEAGGTDFEANAAFIAELYKYTDEISVLSDGTVLLVSELAGNIYPGTGVVTECNKIRQIDEEGKPVDDKNLQNLDSSVNSPTHQGGS